MTLRLNLKAPCEHGRYDDCDEWPSDATGDCPGGVLLPLDSLIIVKEGGEWPEWAKRAVAEAMASVAVLDTVDALVNQESGFLDALAAATPGDR